jgi:peptide/nickel transport system permease protein
VSAAATTVAVPPRPLRWVHGIRTRWAHAWVVAAVVVLLVVLCCVFAPLVAPHSPDAVDLSSINVGPSSAHWLGTDAVGRDLLSRLIYGGRTALLVPLLIALLAGLAGTALALVSAWCGRWVDYVIARLFDVAFSFPGILLAILATAVLGPGIKTMTISLSIAYTPYVGRVLRSEAIRQRRLPYISATSLQGSSGIGVVARHLLPNIAQLVFAQLTLTYAYSFLDAASLSFLGLGIQPPTPDWGQMVSEGEAGLTGGHPQEALFAGAMIMILVVAVTVIGNRMADRAEGQS